MLTNAAELSVSRASLGSEVVEVAFVHGHPRDLGWVRAHRRPPNRAESGQLSLIAAVPPAEVVALGPARADERPATADDVGPPAHN